VVIHAPTDRPTRGLTTIDARQWAELAAAAAAPLTRSVYPSTDRSDDIAAAARAGQAPVTARSITRSSGAPCILLYPSQHHSCLLIPIAQLPQPSHPCRSVTRRPTVQSGATWSLSRQVGAVQETDKPSLIINTSPSTKHI